ncbi:MAG: branched-chain amino acid ABC transporter permease [Candidatus Tectimicrobiota bacterium]|nr:MAG: branched-chain amino acid ABC transporter permease [Candidatus Tectomicrobia bacterium]
MLTAYMLGQALLSGLLMGIAYGLMGAGFNLIYGVLRLVNLAHGEFLMLAAFATYWLHVLLGLDPLSALPITVPLFFLLGLGLYRLLIPPLQRAADPETTSFLAFFGLSLALATGAFLAWGATPRGIPNPYPLTALSLGGFFFPFGRLLSAAVSLVVALLFLYLLYYTYAGKALRALIDNNQAAQLLGIHVQRLSAYAFALGLGLIAVVGTLTPLMFPSIVPSMGFPFTIVSVVVVVLGGLGNPLGALLGGIVFGVVLNLAGLVLSMSLAPAISFAVLILMIMWRPEGLLPR